MPLRDPPTDRYGDQVESSNLEVAPWYLVRISPCSVHTVRSEHGRYKNCISTHLVLLHPVVFSDEDGDLRGWQWQAATSESVIASIQFPSPCCANDVVQHA